MGIKILSNSFQPCYIYYFKGELQLELRQYSYFYTDYNFSNLLFCYSLRKLIKAVKAFKDNNI